MTHTIPQGEGGEQGDALMPLFFSLGQHSALVAIQEDLHDNEFLFALLDDIHIATTPHRVGKVYTSLDHPYPRKKGRCGTKSTDPGVARFCAPFRQTRRQSLGEHHWAIHNSWRRICARKMQLSRCCWNAFLQSLIQSSSSLLLHCGSARANFLLRVVKPEARACSQRHNEGLLSRSCTWTQDIAQMRKWQPCC